MYSRKSRRIAEKLNLSKLNHIINALISSRKAIWSKVEVTILKIFPLRPPLGRLGVSLHMWKLNLYQKTVVTKSGCMKPCLWYFGGHWWPPSSDYLQLWLIWRLWWLRDSIIERGIWLDDCRIRQLWDVTENKRFWWCQLSRPNFLESKLALIDDSAMSSVTSQS